MKKIVLAQALLVAFFSLTAFVGDKNKTAVYNVDTQKSTLKWTGRKVTGEHSGNVKISNGSLNFEGNTLKSGSFEIDLTTLTVTDIQDKASNDKLVGHLKNDDFFSVEKHPKATFVITKVQASGNEKADITGNLTIKGIANPVTFPAVIKISGNNISASGKIVVDRTKYDIKFKSASFFENLGDKAIEDNFDLDVNIVAAKKNS
jgi:polyisoprenoid-binding protein YceI